MIYEIAQEAKKAIENDCDAYEIYIDESKSIELDSRKEELNFAKEKIELQTLIPFWGSYEIHCQGTSEYQQGGWGNFDDLTLYAIGFILEKGPCNFGAMVL